MVPNPCPTQRHPPRPVYDGAVRKVAGAYRRFAQQGGWVARIPLVVLLVAIVWSRGRISLWLEICVALVMVNLYVRPAVASDRPLGEIGLGPRHALRSFLLGAAAATALISATIGVFEFKGWYRADPQPLTGPMLARFGYYVLLFLAVAVFEEAFSRGWLFMLLSKRWGVWVALAASSALFGALHLANPEATALSAIGIALHAGLFLGGLLLLFRNLWAPIGAHFAWNLVEGPVWGTPVSGLDVDALIRADISGPELWTGGEFGPEAGLVTIIIGLTAAVSIIAAAHRTGRMTWPPVPEPVTPATTPPALP